MASYDFSNLFFYSGDATQRFKDYTLDRSRMEYGSELITENVSRMLDRREEMQQWRADLQREKEAEQRANLARYTSNKVSALNRTVIYSADKIMSSLNNICGTVSTIPDEVRALNRRADMMVEQQRLQHIELKRIAELLMIPDSEKERIHAITLGIKFFTNASKDRSLFSDALEEFLKAEALQKQDYFVLHRIGCIYLFAPDHMDIDKARDYFTRAAKYASVESDPGALVLANMLINPLNKEYSALKSSKKAIGLLAADSFEKAALAAYVMQDYSGAIELQKKATSLSKTALNYVKNAKYLIADGSTDPALKDLSRAIDIDPKIVTTVFAIPELFLSPSVIDLLEKTNRELNARIQYLITTRPDDVRVNELYQSVPDSFINKSELYRQMLSKPYVSLEEKERMRLAAEKEMEEKERAKELENEKNNKWAVIIEIYTNDDNAYFMPTIKTLIQYFGMDYQTARHVLLTESKEIGSSCHILKENLSFADSGRVIDDLRKLLHAGIHVFRKFI